MKSERFPVRDIASILIKMGITFVKKGDTYLWDEFTHGETIDWVDTCVYTGQLREYHIQRHGQGRSFETVPLTCKESVNLANKLDLMFTNIELTNILKERETLLDIIDIRGGSNQEFTQLSNFDDYILQLKELASAYESKITIDPDA